MFQYRQIADLEAVIVVIPFAFVQNCLRDLSHGQIRRQFRPFRAPSAAHQKIVFPGVQRKTIQSLHT